MRRKRDILGNYFRANPDYQLVAFDRLPLEAQQSLADLQQDDDLYGVLNPRRASGLSVKSVCQDTALLIYTLAESGPLPDYVRKRLGERSNDAVCELVLDGVLEMATSTEGPFVTGAAADAWVFHEEASVGGQGRAAQLSRAALEYAEQLRIDDAALLSARLYRYNTVPATRRWRQQLPSTAAVRSWLGIDEGAAASTLARNWRSRSEDGRAGWLHWQSAITSTSREAGGDGRLYKLYISPRPEILPKAWPGIVNALTKSPVMSFKVGSGMDGILRPDKVVAYCDRFEDLEQAATRVQDELDGCTPQSVPFSAGIDADGVLSWGVDPPAGQLSVALESWRMWVTNQLAVALVAARTQPFDGPAWRFAIGRLESEGIDVETWTPRQSLWK